MTKSDHLNNLCHPEKFYTFMASELCGLSLRELKFMYFDGMYFLPNSPSKIEISWVEKLEFSQTQTWIEKITFAPKKLNGTPDYRYRPETKVKELGVVHEIIVTGLFTKRILAREEYGKKLLDPIKVVDKFNEYISIASRNIDLYKSMPSCYDAFILSKEKEEYLKEKLKREFSYCDMGEFLGKNIPVDQAKDDRFSFLYENLIRARAEAIDHSMSFHEKYKVFAS